MHEAELRNSDPEGVETPPSIASSPHKAGDGLGLPEDANPPRSKPQLSLDLSQTAPTVHALHGLWLSARHVRKDADSVHNALHMATVHVAALQRQQAALATELERERQASEVRLMEKDCEIRLAQSEAAAYKLAATARSSTVAALETTVATLQSERDSATAIAVDATSAAKTMRGRIALLEAASENDQARLAEAHCTVEELREAGGKLDETRSALHTAQADAAAAAGQLVEACEENARLSERAMALQEEVEWHEAAAAGLQDDVAALRARLEELTAENAELRRDVAAARRSSDAAGLAWSPQATPLRPLPPLASPPPLPPAEEAVTPTQDLLDACDDVLALEVSHLRRRTRELAAQLSQAEGSAPALSALEREVADLRADNASLRGAARGAAVDAATARQELLQVRAEARTLHTQLADVIASLAASGMNGASPVEPAHAAAAPEESTSAAAGIGVEVAAQQGEVEAAAGAAAAAVKDARRKDTPEGSESGGIAAEWRPAAADMAAAAAAGLRLSTTAAPSTPTWDVARVSVRPVSDSCSSDLILAELRSAMATLDGVASADIHIGGLGVASGAGGGAVSVPKLALQQEASIEATPAASAAGGAAVEGKSASDVLQSISQGIAALEWSGRGFTGDLAAALATPREPPAAAGAAPAESSMMSSSAGGAASVTPRGGMGSVGPVDWPLADVFD